MFRCYRKFLVLSLLLLARVGHADLAPMSDGELSKVSGQAIFKVQDFVNYGQSDGTTLDFTRYTLGAKIDVNLNIDLVELGNYYRPYGTNCREGGKFCDNNTVATTQEQKNANLWGCQQSTCASNITYNDNGTTRYIGDTDIRIRNLQLGTVSGSTINTMTLQDPYLEFAFSGTGVNRKLVGFRNGFMQADGVMGNSIDVLSGFIEPDVSLLGIGVGKILLGGVRTRGFIDPRYQGFLQGLAAGEQLPPVQKNVLNATNDWFMSLQTQNVDYPVLNGVTKASPTAQPGFWMNLIDGLSASLTDGALPNNKL